MIRYELKKIFSNWGSRIALMLMAAILVFSCAVSVSDIYWINEQGEAEYGYAASRKRRDAMHQWAGPLDEAKFAAVIREIHRINNTPEGRSQDPHQNDIAYGWTQGFRDIRYILAYSFAPAFREYDYFVTDSLTEAQAGAVYANRTKLLKQWLSEVSMFSDTEKDYLITQYEKLETPMHYDCFQAWDYGSEGLMTIIMGCCLVLGYLVAGIFANEFRWKTDSVYFSALYGRDRAIRAKLLAAFWLVTGVYWVSVLLASAWFFGYLGIDGWNCPVQLSQWKCFYNVTFFQQYLLIIFGGYLGNLCICGITMWVSAKLKSAFFAVTVPFVLVLLPNTLSQSSSALVQDILGLLPDQLLHLQLSMNLFNLYSFAGHVAGAIPILLVLYSLLTLASGPMVYREYRRKQVA